MVITGPPPDVSPPPVDLPPIVLPDIGDGQRRRRRRERQRVNRQRGIAAGAVVVAAIAAVALLRGTHTPTTPKTASPPLTNKPSVPVVASVLIEHVDAGATQSIAALLPSPDGAGGTVLIFPATTPLPTVSDNLPHARPQATVTVDDAGLAALFSSVGPLDVPVPGAGTVTVKPADTPRFFVVGGAASPVAHQQAYWNAWLTRLRDNPAAIPTREEVRQAVIVLIQGTWQVAVAPGPASAGG